MDAAESKAHGGCEAVKFYCGLEEFSKTNNRQRTQAREIEGSRERSTVVTRGTAELLDTSVRVQYRTTEAVAIVLYWNTAFNTIKQDPYVRFCERAGSRVIPMTRPTRCAVFIKGGRS